LLTDDICVVSINEGVVPMVVPGFQQLKLWDDALKKIGVKSENLQKVRKNIDMDKFFVPASDVCNHPVPVEAVFILDSHKESNFEILELKGMEKVPPLLDMTFRLNFIEGTESKAAHFTQCARIDASTKVFKITRPERGFLLNELVAKIQECL